MTRETLTMTREDSDSRLLTRDSTRDSAVMTRAQLCKRDVITGSPACFMRVTHAIDNIYQLAGFWN